MNTMNTEIRPLRREDIPEAVEVIRESFATVAAELGLTEENAPRFTAFAMSGERLRWQLEQGRPMFPCSRTGPWRAITPWPQEREKTAS